MERTTDGDRLLQLLKVRGEKTDEAKRVREREKAKLWAAETYQRLLTVLAEDSWLHEERFVILERLKGKELNEFDRMHLEALSELLGVSVDEAVMIKEVRAGEKRWHAASLVLSTLRTLLET